MSASTKIPRFVTRFLCCLNETQRETDPRALREYTNVRIIGKYKHSQNVANVVFFLLISVRAAIFDQLHNFNDRDIIDQAREIGKNQFAFKLSGLK